jgi:alginate O-acetyltransferase complex protein AlgJ
VAGRGHLQPIHLFPVLSAQSQSGGQRAFWQVLTILSFLGLLWMPTLDHFFHWDHAPVPVENRRPAQWPQFRGIGRSRTYIAGLEGYFNDHFGFRKRLVRWNNHWKGQLFHDATAEVLIGRDGWLYYSGCDMLAHWTRQRTWSAEDLANWKRLLEMRRDWLRARHCNYILVVPPDKQTIYPEHLPDWMPKSDKPSKIQQLTRYLKAHSTVRVLDLSPALTAAKKIRADYLQTDTHWNQFGGFVGCQAVAEALEQQMPGIHPLPTHAFAWHTQVRPPGDLTRLLGRAEGFSENDAVRATPVPPFTRLKVRHDPVRFPRRVPSEDRIAFTINEAGSGKAIVFRDSYAEFWYPFLGQHFREVIYVWHEDWDRPLIEREKPDVVIDEMLERFFNLVDPVELAHQDEASVNNTCVNKPPDTRPE